MEAKTKTHTPNKVRRRKQREAAKEARNEARAIAKFVKAAPRKLRLVIDGIRGKSTEEAASLLRFTPNRVARVIEKVLMSAVSNAENNMQMDPDALYIHQAYVDGGPVIKRFRPRAMGRATPIRKRTSHITIIVKERGDEI
ncbi:MAG: 50S ribosomal protein L22 [Candidatus Eremiobacteraeota bacterium]|nr:50S ribosomal protein L22 [Candidatus Eremiobacteraeota bacterium]